MSTFAETGFTVSPQAKTYSTGYDIMSYQACGEAVMPYQKFHAERIEKGLCKDCGNPRGEAGTTVFCRTCANNHSAKMAKRKSRLRDERVEKGLCYNCGKSPGNGKGLCAKCREKARDAYHRTSKNRVSRKLSSEICKRCTDATFSKSNYCRKHWLENILRHSHLDRLSADILFSKLEDQEFKCFYTGIDLVPGINASLDHLKSRSKNPDRHSDIANLVWCDRRVNAMKGELNYEEFIHLCRTIAEQSRL